MTGLRVLYQFVRADFLERIRRYSFIVTMVATLIAAYLSVPPPESRLITVALGNIRGIYNSAWVGAALAIMTSCFLSLIGFYLVKNAVERDVRTRVGQILWGTPTSSFTYLLGKGISNFLLLTSLVLVTLATSVVMQFVRGEDTTIHILTLAAPFIFMTLPCLAVIAALAVLFESLPILRGTAGNVIFFFLWVFILIASIDTSVGPKNKIVPATNDMAGLSVLLHDMSEKVVAQFPDYDGNIAIGAMVEDSVKTLRTFRWEGIIWTAPVILARLWWVAAAIAIILLTSLWFAQFRERQGRLKRKRKPELAANGEAEPISISRRKIHLPAWTSRVKSPMAGIVIGELRLMLSSAGRWWYLVALGLLIAELVAPLKIAQQYILAVAWIWPMAQWSVMGCRERLFGTEQLIFSAPDMMRRQLPALWIAGSILTILTGAGIGLRFLVTGNLFGLLVWLSGAMFVPALALFFGVLTSGRKMFEVVYTFLWYAGPISGAAVLDYTGGSARQGEFILPVSYLLLTAALLGTAIIWRARQARS